MKDTPPIATTNGALPWLALFSVMLTLLGFYFFYYG